MHAQSVREEAASGFQWVIKVRGGDPVHVRGQFPTVGVPGGPGPEFTLYEDRAGHKPLCSVARRSNGTGSDDGLVVTGPDGDVLGVLRPPARRTRLRPRYEMELPDGTRLVGIGGTVGSWVLYAVLSPLLLVYNVGSFVGGYGGPDWFLPTRTAWRTRDGLGLGRAPLKFYGLTDKYKVRTARLDARVAYVQAVLHDWCS
ncbi:hypothetical protein GQS52_18790 [Streptomyces sp. SCUT-3]|nr:hypothetical protein C0036_21165 [Streptomyces sp. DJ]QMV23481.1 hypothetical protein GQS52_18790 [Streptomyces sp. SCUT-3]